MFDSLFSFVLCFAARAGLYKCDVEGDSVEEYTGLEFRLNLGDLKFI